MSLLMLLYHTISDPHKMLPHST